MIGPSSGGNPTQSLPRCAEYIHQKSPYRLHNYYPFYGTNMRTNWTNICRWTAVELFIVVHYTAWELGLPRHWTGWLASLSYLLLLLQCCWKVSVVPCYVMKTQEMWQITQSKTAFALGRRSRRRAVNFWIRNWSHIATHLVVLLIRRPFENSIVSIRIGMKFWQDCSSAK